MRSAHDAVSRAPQLHFNPSNSKEIKCSRGVEKLTFILPTWDAGKRMYMLKVVWDLAILQGFRFHWWLSGLVGLPGERNAKAILALFAFTFMNCFFMNRCVQGVFHIAKSFIWSPLKFDGIFWVTSWLHRCGSVSYAEHCAMPISGRNSLALRAFLFFCPSVYSLDFPHCGTPFQ